MPFALPSTFNWFKHSLLAAKRVLFQRKNTYFIDLSNNPDMTLLKDAFGMPLMCPICGYCLAEFRLEQGWTARACSATGFREIMNSLHFNRWQNELIASQLDKDANKNAEINDNLSMSSK